MIPAHSTTRKTRFDDRRGFTLIELMMVAAIISLLAALAQPAYQRVLVKARATEAISNIQAVRVALQTYNGIQFTFPDEVGSETVPPELVEYLPENFSFTFDDYVLDYDNFIPTGDGLPQIGVTVIPTDESFGRAMVALVGERVWERGGGRFTMVLE